MNATLPDADACRTRVGAALDRWLTPDDAWPPRLLEAMRYSVLSEGKRLRPLLCYYTGRALGIDDSRLDGPACALEMIHAYSLIHDDLPAMDDDDLRRGRPTCHRAFDEATAILAGDSLQVLAFQVLAEDAAMDTDAAARVEMIRLLARASGPAGMAGGQAMDLEAQGRTPSSAALEAIHRRKTGALIHASVMMPAAAVAGLDPDRHRALDSYARHIGLAFQIQDDILDVIGDSALMGKQQGADAERDKATYPALLGLDGARREARRTAEAARDALAPLGAAAAALAAVAGFVVERAH